MHPVLESLGLAFEREIIDDPPSLSVIVTVPAVNALLGVDVVLENAEKVPVPAMVAVTPSTRMEINPLRMRSTSGPRLVHAELDGHVVDHALVALRTGGEPGRDVQIRGRAGTQVEGSRAPSTQG